MGRNRDGSYKCDDCPKGSPAGIRITATAVFNGQDSVWRVSCLNGHAIQPVFGLDFLVAPNAGRG